MKNFKYKIRASKSYDLVSACAKKVRNKMQWDFDAKDGYSDTLIKIAVEVFNKEEFGYQPYQFITFDMDNGNKYEQMAIEYYDKAFGSSYLPLYLKRGTAENLRAENGFATGERDFGDGNKTIDCKTSTCKNIFDAKRFADVEPKYACQINTYGLLYGTPELELYNFLAPKSFIEIEQMIYSERKYNYDHDDAYYDALQEKLERQYAYDPFDGYGIEQRTQRKEVEPIENWQETLYLSVEKMNRFITEKLEK